MITPTPTLVPAMDREFCCDPVRTISNYYPLVLEYHITLEYKQVFMKNENRWILYCQIFQKQKNKRWSWSCVFDPPPLLVVMMWCFTSSCFSSYLTTEKNGNFNSWLSLFLNTSRNRLLILYSINSIKAFLRGISLFGPTITILIFPFFDGFFCLQKNRFRKM